MDTLISLFSTDSSLQFEWPWLLLLWGKALAAALLATPFIA